MSTVAPILSGLNIGGATAAAGVSRYLAIPHRHEASHRDLLTTLDILKKELRSPDVEPFIERKEGERPVWSLVQECVDMFSAID
jgi:hypothetical protein